ncbi:NTP transferase domain-containing protein [bacterium]|nr:NTP transferase domain-containing protein [candidate division CSSED10-310 bacterium]
MKLEKDERWRADEKVDAVILAGSHRNPKRLIKGQNKAFLQLMGKPLIAYVTTACLESDRLNRIVVVGPRNALESALHLLLAQYPNRLMIVQQRSRILENVWNGFLATFPDGNNLPVNRRIETLLLGGHFPIKKKAHLNIIVSVYSAVAGQMIRHQRSALEKGSVVAAMERRFDEFRHRFERQEWFMGKMGVETLLTDGHILQETPSGIRFREQFLFDYFAEWERRFKKPIFITGSDVPLISGPAIADFLNRCERLSGDFIVSTASLEMLRFFYYGKNKKPGILRPYLSLREAHIRACNMLLVRPNRVGNKELIQESFGIRKMTEWRNIIALFGKLLRLSSRFQTLRMGLLLHLVAMLRRYGYVSAGDRIRRHLRTTEFEELLSRLFMTNLKLVESPYSGVSLDVDTEADFEKLSENFDYWKTVQDELVEKVGDRMPDNGRTIGIFSDALLDRNDPIP